MKCFYHGDLDGKAAGFCVHAWVGIKTQPDRLVKTDFVQINYNHPFPFDKILGSEQVWIVDYSISPEEMTRLLSITKDVTWIDHHKMAIEKYANYPHKIRGIRKDGEAGCVLTWKYIHWYTARGDGKEDFNQTEKEGLEVPLAIELVGDRDIWVWKHGDLTRNFFAGSQLYDTDPGSDFWWKCLDREIKPLPLPNTGNAEAKKRGDVFWEKLLLQGETINRYKKQTDKDVNKNYGYDTIFEGYKCFAINRPGVSSDRLENRIEEYDILLPYFYDGKQFTVTLYSNSVDVSVIAKRHGGGGHVGAAGFSCKELPFDY